ncbi:hypothetical protein LSM04_008556 [Trypanosoma melophagium]|uniref:uncharacterized protein n=1 Tax=Trypanosoma melophagium TaxID=715481 RepID=UPI003519EFC1|nr:hypothetical protein LSM04_008556 [Trypanosoma melophagium]
MNLYTTEDPFAFGYGNGYGMLADVEAIDTALSVPSKANNVNKNNNKNNKVKDIIDKLNNTDNNNKMLSENDTRRAPTTTVRRGSDNPTITTTTTNPTSGVNANNSTKPANLHIQQLQQQQQKLQQYAGSRNPSTDNTTGNTRNGIANGIKPVQPYTLKNDAAAGNANKTFPTLDGTPQGRRVTVRKVPPLPSDILKQTQIQQQPLQQQRQLPTTVRGKRPEEGKREGALAIDRVRGTTMNAGSTAAPRSIEKVLQTAKTAPAANPILPTNREIPRQANGSVQLQERVGNGIHHYHHVDAKQQAAKRDAWEGQQKEKNKEIVTQTVNGGNRNDVHNLHPVKRNETNATHNVSVPAENGESKVSEEKNHPQGKGKNEGDTSMSLNDSQLWECIMGRYGDATPVDRSSQETTTIKSPPESAEKQKQQKQAQHDDEVVSFSPSVSVQTIPQAPPKHIHDKNRAELEAWAATPILMTRYAQYMLQQQTKQHAAVAATVSYECAGELMTLNGEVHNVVDQLVYRDRPRQLQYPAVMPLVIEAQKRRRRPRTPRSFYGVAGKRVGPDWFRSALENVVVVPSPDLRPLEAEEAQEKLRRGGRR